MNHKLPPDAFEFYVSLGPNSSYQVVAEHYGVSKRTVQNCADREEWTKRMAKIEHESRERADKRIGETMDDIRERHMKTLRAMNGRAIEGLKSFPITSAMDAMRTAEMVIKLERLIVGEPTERNALSVEEVTRQEIQSLLVVDEGEDAEGEPYGGEVEGGDDDGEYEADDDGG